MIIVGVTLINLIIYLFFFLLSGDTFVKLVDEYLRPALRKGVPPLFNNLRTLYSDKEKVCDVKTLLKCWTGQHSDNM